MSAPGLFLALFLGPLIQGGEEAAVSREWHVRDLALGRAPSGALEAALERPTWHGRDAGLDALERALSVGRGPSEDGALLARVRALAEDSDAPEQARALGVLARWPTPVSLADAAAVAAHRLPAVRLALIELLRVHGAAGDRALLSTAMHDPDARVAEAAVRAWATRVDEHSDWSTVPSGGFEALLATLEDTRAPDAALASLAAASPAADGVANGALVEALRLRLHGTGEVERIAAGWTAVRNARGLALLLRAARTAPRYGPELGDALLDTVADRRAEHATWTLEGAVLASEPAHLLERVRTEDLLGLEGQVQLWQLLIGRGVHWREDFAGPWLASEERDLRLRVAMTLATEDAGSSDGAVGRLLVRALGDEDPAVVEVTFRALAGARDPSPWFEDLHAAWRRLPGDERGRFLRFLPRTAPALPFRGDLVELLDDDQARAEALELLARFGPDAELAQLVGARLDPALEEALEAALAGPAPAAERACLGLTRAFVALAGEGATPRLEAMLVRGAPLSEELAKHAASALGRTETGRAVLARELAREHEGQLPARIAIEAALALADIERLARHYDGCDVELRTRIVEVCGAASGAPALELLVAVVRDEREAPELRESACAALASHADRGARALEQLVTDGISLELRAAALRALGGSTNTGARAFLFERLAGLEAREHDAALVEHVQFERAVLLESLADAKPVPEWLAVAWLARPRAAARSDLAARFVGDRLPAAEFRWRSELAFAAGAARSGALASALEVSAASDWPHLDGRCLAALGRTALSEAPREEAATIAAARALLDAALVALAGEGEASDRAAQLLFCRHRAWLAAEAIDDGRATAVHAERLLDLRARGEVSAVLWDSEFGAFDPAGGIDPVARLDAAVLQGRARAALEAGHVHQAQDLAHASRAALGFSEAALRAQVRIEKALAEH